MYIMANILSMSSRLINSKQKFITQFLLKKLFTKHVCKKHTSALFIPGNEAFKTFSYLTPYLDFDERFKDKENLQRELIIRGLDINVNDLIKVWDVYKSVSSSKMALEEKRLEVANRIKSLKKNLLNDQEKQEIEKLVTQGRLIKQELKSIKEILWEMEEDVIMRGLKLPNNLDERTPVKDPVILKNTSKNNTDESGEMSHIEIGHNLNLLEYKNAMHYYLCNEAAAFELDALTHVANVLQEKNILRVYPADFSKSLVVEGAGLDHQDPLVSFVLRDVEEIEKDSPNRMHLVGSASTVAFLAMHSKQLINPKYFPIKYFAVGRQYSPYMQNSSLNGLFNVSQASAAHVFALNTDDKSNDYKIQIDEFVEIVCGLYDDLCENYRVVLKSAPELQCWESLKISFQVWSPHHREYVETGYISACGKYFSKRLQILYQTPTKNEFPAIITGTILNVPKLLGCLIERNPEKFIIPSVIKRI